MAPVVHFRAAVALAGRFPALAGVDLSLDQGEVVVVVGANGAGKTSLLRACAGLLPVTSGEATVLGVDLTTDHTSVRRYVGLLGHAAPLYDELSAAENVHFAVRALGLPVSGADEALERVGLTGRLRTTPAGRLSAGQRRRVALAALARPPPRALAARRAARRPRRHVARTPRPSDRRGRVGRGDGAALVARAAALGPPGRSRRLHGGRPGDG